MVLNDKIRKKSVENAKTIITASKYKLKILHIHSYWRKIFFKIKLAKFEILYPFLWQKNYPSFGKLKDCIKLREPSFTTRIHRSNIYIV
ncbi:hypothetical protein EB796_021362 [Bugula neritina]|uniref:Uncharacterized protein n=1 Tax=Bugula neritina TaxID=10212 RepID=A0A7J7J3Q5_BUGNE|nr:hypothetical protein EB796_021364 [Bugula neritina]KAF6020334.1 hypothetical protein EB796_021362 [Bugula neritina]